MNNLSIILNKVTGRYRKFSIYHTSAITEPYKRTSYNTVSTIFKPYSRPNQVLLRIYYFRRYTEYVPCIDHVDSLYRSMNE